MKFVISILIIFFISSCKEKHVQRGGEESSIISKDSLTHSKNSADRFADQSDLEKTIYIERAHLDLKKYFIAIKSKFTLPDTLKEDSSYYFEKNYFFVYNKISKSTDSVQLEMDNNSPYDLDIEDLSDSLGFKTLLLQISWTGDSDMPMYEFVEYDSHSVKNLFSINSLRTLQRKDKWTLTGFVSDRDELVYSGESDYPLTVSLKTYEVTVTNPPIQYIGYPSRALAEMKVFRSRTLDKSSAYIIRKGTELTVDTLYRLQNLVRLIVSDSVILYARPDKIRDRIQQNTAG
jgi:hypothetical protein